MQLIPRVIYFYGHSIPFYFVIVVVSSGFYGRQISSVSAMQAVSRTPPGSVMGAQVRVGSGQRGIMQGAKQEQGDKRDLNEKSKAGFENVPM